MSLFEDPSNIELSEEPLGPGATILRNFTMPGNGNPVRAQRCGFQGPIPPHDHTGRFSHVRCNDKLRRSRLGDGQNRLSLRPDGPLERPAVAANAGVSPAAAAFVFTARKSISVPP